MAKTRHTPGSQASLREANRSRIVEALKRHGGITQVEIASATGLSQATVSNIVKELQADGVLSIKPTSRNGRRAMRVTLAKNLGLIVGAHFGERSLRVGVADLAQTVLMEQHMPLPDEHRADLGLDRAALLAADLLDSIGASMQEVQTFVIGIPAPVDNATGQIAARRMIKGWSGVQIADVMRARIRRPVLIDNDANLGALAEARHGAARDSDQAVYIRVSHGLGSGLIINGALFRGFAGTAGEIGHVTVDENGAVCRCGNRGCLETLVRGPVLLKMLRDSHGPMTLRDVIHRAQDGDAGCRRIIADAGRHIGVATASMCNLLNPQRIVIGGELAQAGNILIEPLASVVERFAIPSAAAEVEIVQGELGDRAEMLGAIALGAESLPLVRE